MSFFLSINVNVSIYLFPLHVKKFVTPSWPNKAVISKALIYVLLSFIILYYSPYIVNLSHPSYFAGCDNYAGAVIATQELLRLHHTRIKFAGYHFFLQSEKERYDGFCGAMRQAGFETNQDNLLLNIDYGQLKEQILKQETTAIFCCNDKLALKVINTLTELGIRVPHDVSIMGFDDWDHEW